MGGCGVLSYELHLTVSALKKQWAIGRNTTQQNSNKELLSLQIITAALCQYRQRAHDLLAQPESSHPQRFRILKGVRGTLERGTSGSGKAGAWFHTLREEQEVRRHNWTYVDSHLTLEIKDAIKNDGDFKTVPNDMKSTLRPLDASVNKSFKVIKIKFWRWRQWKPRRAPLQTVT